MFTRLISLLLVLLLINVVPEGASEEYPLGLGLALGVGLALLAALLVLIALQNRLGGERARRLLYLLAHVEFFGFLVVYHFILGAERLYFSPQNGYSFQLLLAAVSLAFYFVTLFVYELTLARHKARMRAAWQSLHFMLPLAIPFLLLQGLIDLSLFFGPAGGAIVALGGLAIFIALALLFPYVLRRSWGCRPLPAGPLRQRLESLCSQARFRHGGLLTWPAMRHVYTAGIVGILPALRYVLFTEPLLRNLSLEEIESILAHEMGHSHHRHLLLYPCILFGLLVVMTLFAILIETPLTRSFELHALANPSGGAGLWGLVVFYGCYALLIYAYIRLVFGLFSRAFERQADLFPLEIGLRVEYTIGALDRVAVLNGNIHKKPSWHHYSIAQRITFLKRVAANSELIGAHHRRVRRLLLGYVAVLLVLLVIACGPLFPSVLGLGAIARVAESWNERVTAATSGEMRAALAQRYVTSHGLPEKALPAIEVAYIQPDAGKTPGVLEFYSAVNLLEAGELELSAELLERAWRLFDFRTDPEARSTFVNATRTLLHESSEREISLPQERALRARLALTLPSRVS